ncbi:uncharacterized protein LOC103316874 isoform X1 [Nasonia vitripennis]|uniref:CHK kinase-like domain-containing protein n=2 Tax=Nasonia vitripennis TaxID=7425 RepID=A0A7M7LUS2_NASVI|nr:uncharacterized protein LOC103316874 isoform X1 [Nasonia vitripennis]
MSPNSNNGSICDNFISLDEVSTILGKLYPSSNVKILNYFLEPFSDEPFGYLSMHNLLTVEILDPDESRSSQLEEAKTCTLTFFVKSMLPSPTVCQKLLFEEESKFFREVVPQLLENYKSEFWAAECYLAKQNVIVMEDLRVRGFKMPSIHLSENQLILSVASLARFHASSMLLEEKLKEPLDKVYPGHFEEKLLNIEGVGKKWLITGMEAIEAVAKSVRLDPTNCWSAYRESLDKVKPVPGQKNVLSHGDTWCNNMMFREGMYTCRLVDFQMVTYRFYAVDLVQLIYLNVDRDVRCELENDLIQVYRKVLNQCLRSHGYGGRLMSSDELVKDVEEMRVVGMILAALIFPIALLNGELKEEFTKDPEQLKRYMYVNRKDFVLSAFEKSDEYRDKIMGIVKDLTDFMNSR